MPDRLPPNAGRFLKILGFNPRDDLAGLNGIADRHVSFQQPTADPESQIDRILGLDLTGQTDRIAT